MTGERLTLARQWIVGEQIGRGGFGRVYEAVSGDEQAVAKFVPKAPGADRELLFVDLPNVRNVIPIIDSGEHADHWVLIMPRAELSLRDHLDLHQQAPALAEVLGILKDVCDSLSDLEGKVVHRDLKPENLLRLGGHWCLADFGISRYAEATTAPDTQKFALSPPYAAPERWRSERATSSADVYAVGVMAYEMLAGSRPFPGPGMEDFREQHLHSQADELRDVPVSLGALIEECLSKAPGARPGAATVRLRLERVSTRAVSPGIARLQQANRAEVGRLGNFSRQQSEAQSEAERRSALADAAEKTLQRISADLLAAITDAAPSATESARTLGGWGLRLGQAELRMSPIRAHGAGEWGQWNAPSFDVISVADLNLKRPTDEYGYEGRSHSLWYGDIQQTGQYGWFEVAFMISQLIPRHASQEPFSLDPDTEAAKAVWTGMAEFQVAWPFTPLVVGELDEFIDRWAAWFAEAADGRLGRPSTMPERAGDGSWRRG